MRLVICIFLCMFLFSCNSNNTESDKAATIGDSIVVTYNDVDSRIEQELYSDLHRIYLRRIKSLDEILDQRVLAIESKKSGKSKEMLLNENYDLHNNIEEIEKFKTSHGISLKIPYFSGYLTYIDVTSTFGQELAKQAYKKYIDKLYLDDLRKKFKITSYLYPPLPPKISLDSLGLIHYKGNLRSETTLLIISDVECSTCREASPLQFKLFEKYKDKVRFGYSSYSENANLGIKALEAAARQNKFWEMYKQIIEHPLSFDTLNYIKFASLTQLDTTRFKKDLRDKNLEKSILKNFEYLQKKKIFATPTVLLNNRIMPDIFNEDQINMEIEKLIKESNL